MLNILAATKKLHVFIIVILYFYLNNLITLKKLPGGVVGERAKTERDKGAAKASSTKKRIIQQQRLHLVQLQQVLVQKNQCLSVQRRW